MPTRPPLFRVVRNREAKQPWKKANPQKRLTGRALQERNQRIKVRDRFTCQNQQCGLVTTLLQVDHRLPVAAGGDDSDQNCRCLCEVCHTIKTKIENHGMLLINPDAFPTQYALAKRVAMRVSQSRTSLEDDVEA